MSKNIDYQQKIMEVLDEYASGLTITDIANKVNIARNTVYRYLGELLGQGTVYTKKIGSYTLYYSKEKSLLYKDSVISFFKGLLANLKKIYSNQEHVFKAIGRNLADSMEIPILKEEREFLKKLKDLDDVEIMESMGKFLPFFNILHDTISISKIDIKKKDKKGVVTFVNSDMLEHTDDYIYYFYLLAGLIEKKLSDYTGKEVIFEILNFETFDQKEISNIKIAFDFQILLPEIQFEGIPESKISDSKVINVDLIKKYLESNLLINIIRSTFFKKKILLLISDNLIYNDLINFFDFIFQDSFEKNISIELKPNFDEKKNNYTDFIVLEKKEIISDKDKILKEKETKVERKIVQKFFEEIEPKHSLIKLKIEIQKAFKLATELSKRISELSTLERDINFDAKKIIEDLTNIYNVKISLSYLKFLVDIIENYFEVKIPVLWKFFIVR